jgi:hypothetical protein
MTALSATQKTRNLWNEASFGCNPFESATLQLLALFHIEQLGTTENHAFTTISHPKPRSVHLQGVVTPSTAHWAGAVRKEAQPTSAPRLRTP